MSIQEHSLQLLLLGYSTFYKLLMSVAWLLWFKNYLSHQSGEVKRGNLTGNEIATATREMIKVVQRQAFPKEMVVLSRISYGTPSLSSVSRRNNLSFVRYVSPLRKFNPVMVDGVISVGGRLEIACIQLVPDIPWFYLWSIMLLIWS